MAKKDYSKLEKDDLLKVIEKLESRKKYGLIWDEEKTKEQFEKESENALPVLKEVKGKEIKTDPSKPANILIEGDNYHALSVLNYTHQGKIDVIYIDPPYNTGKKDFKYKDNFSDGWVEKEDSYRHSKWLSFMSKRLRLAKNLLTVSGVIFISIDDNEFAQLKMLCDEVFSETNYIGMFSVENNPKGRKNGKFISVTNDYCLIYARNFESASFNKIVPKHAADMAVDEKGDFIRKSGKRVLMGENTLNKLVTNFNSSKHYSAYIKDSDLIFKKEKTIKDVDNGLLKKGYKRYITFHNGQFVENTYTEETFKALFEEESLDIREDKIYEKHFSDMMQIKSMLTNNEYEAIVDNKKVLYKIDLKTTSANQQLIELLGGEYFSFPKNVSFIKHLISLHPNRSANVLDFFAGSGTTGQAVLELNVADKSNRRFILCTNNEDNNGTGTKIATDICYPRIDKVIKGYKTRKEDKNGGIGGNLKYFKTSFVQKDEVSDDTRRKLVDQSTEMICLKEATFDEVIDNKNYKLFTDGEIITGILFNLKKIDEFKKKINSEKKPARLYVFSITNDAYEEDFADLDVDHKIVPIPESILEVYKKLFK